MKRVIAICMIVCTTAMVQAQGENKEEGKDDVFKGEIKKVDPDKGTLTVTVKGKEERFDVPVSAKITIRETARTVEPKEGLKDLWFRSAEKAHGTGRFTVEVTVDKKNGRQVTKVHLNTPTGD